MKPLKVKTSFRSPNFDERSAKVSALVFHYTGMRNEAEALQRLCDEQAEARVSAHYMVSEEGLVYRLVEERHRAWHAGVSSWRGCQGLNDCSVGIEIVNPGHEFGYRPFPAKQREAVQRLAADIVERHGIAAPWVLAHSDIAPARKADPGELFDWRSLAQAGVGFFPSLSIDEALRLQRGEEVEARLEELLVSMGYDLSAGRRTCVVAFQRRWRQRQVDGVADAECVAMAEAVLRGWEELTRQTTELA